jgi:7-cyano-7-deazaguanine synthase
MEVRKAVVLLSGGLDSSTAAAIAKAEGFELHALSIDYGQRHSRELDSANAVASALGVANHITIALDLRKFGGSALTSDIAFPTDRTDAEISTGIPVTYVPARNTIFLSLALGLAEAIGARDIFIGVSQIDYSGYPDCRAEFIREFEKLANLATKAGVEGDRFHVHAPLIDLTKARTIERGLELGLDYSLTWSCYQGGQLACGRCDSCKLRLAAFAETGVPDPLKYEP